LTGCDIPHYLYMYVVYKGDVIDDVLISRSHVRLRFIFLWLLM